MVQHRHGLQKLDAWDRTSPSPKEHLFGRAGLRWPNALPVIKPMVKVDVELLASMVSQVFEPFYHGVYTKCSKFLYHKNYKKKISYQYEDKKNGGKTLNILQNKIAGVLRQNKFLNHNFSDFVHFEKFSSRMGKKTNLQIHIHIPSIFVQIIQI